MHLTDGQDATRGRWGVEGYAANDGAAEATSEMAMPVAACNEGYATKGYSASVGNFRSVSRSTDMVFSDGSTLQLANVTDNATTGYTARLTIAVGA